jgi:hypothetical protein
MTNTDHIKIAALLMEIFISIMKECSSEYGEVRTEEQREESWRVWNRFVIEPFAEMLSKDNPQFNRDQFFTVVNQER